MVHRSELPLHWLLSSNWSELPEDDGDDEEVGDDDDDEKDAETDDGDDDDNDDDGDDDQLPGSLLLNSWSKCPPHLLLLLHDKYRPNQHYFHLSSSSLS